METEREYIYFLHFEFEKDRYFSTVRRAVEVAKQIIPTIITPPPDCILVEEDDGLSIYGVYSHNKKHLIATITKYYLDESVKPKMVQIVDERKEKING